MPRPGTHRATADTPTRPVAVPTAVRTAVPSVKWTAANALRRETSHTAARSADALEGRGRRPEAIAHQRVARHPDEDARPAAATRVVASRDACLPTLKLVRPTNAARASRLPRLERFPHRAR